MVEFSEKEKATYAELAQQVLESRNTDQQAEVIRAAQDAIKLIRKQMEGIPDEHIATFCMSLSYLVSRLELVPVMYVADTLERVFDSYAMATAILLGVFDPETSEVAKVAAKPEPVSKPDIGDLNTGMFL